MKNREQKIKREFEPAQAADFLRSVADVLEGKSPMDGEEAAGLFDAFTKASLKLKRKGGAISLQAKVETPLTGEPAATAVGETEGRKTDPDKPKYKALKKRMKSTFGSIRDSLSENRMPEAEVVRSFLDDSVLMVSYPGYGDEYYDAYSETCRRFQSAFEEKDWSGLKTAFEDLKRMKSDCHDRYK